MKKIQIILLISLTLLLQGCIGWLVGDPRPYKCNIGCGDGVVTPDTEYYINSDGKEIKLENFYIERNLNKDFATYPQGGK